jgi:hypothetical protein
MHTLKRSSDFGPVSPYFWGSYALEDPVDRCKQEFDAVIDKMVDMYHCTNSEEHKEELNTAIEQTKLAKLSVIQAFKLRE